MDFSENPIIGGVGHRQDGAVGGDRGGLKHVDA